MSCPAHPTYADLTDHNGTIRPDMVAAIAKIRADQELRGYAAIGWVRDPETVLREQTCIVDMMAKTQRDNAEAMRLRAALPMAERAARELELAAELARTAIPPRKAEALTLVLRADAVRRAVPAT